MNPSHFQLMFKTLALSCAVIMSTPAWAEQQHVVLENATSFEGNNGERVIELPIGYTDGSIDLTATARYPMTLRASTITAGGNSFNPATGGLSCAPGVDYISFSNLMITIPAGAPWGAVTVPVTVCGDTQVEPLQHLFVALECLSGVMCTERSVAIVAIRNDDGAPSASIGDLSMSEPLTGSRDAIFEVRLSHPAPTEVSMHYQTVDGTAIAFRCRGAGNLSFCSGDFNARGGTLTLPAASLGGRIRVPVRADSFREIDERFTLRLSAPVNATLARATATATIRDLTLLPMVGTFSMSQDPTPLAAAAEAQALRLEWSPPAGLSPSALRTLDLRLRGLGQSDHFLRWQPDHHTLALCQRSHGPKNLDGADIAHDPADRLTRMDAVCGTAEVIGGNGRLVFPQVTLKLASAKVRWDGKAFKLELPLRFSVAVAGKTYTVDIGSADVFGNETPFLRAGQFSLQPNTSTAVH